MSNATASAADDTHAQKVLGFSLSSVFFAVNCAVTALASYYTKKTEKEARVKAEKRAADLLLRNQTAIAQLEEDLTRATRKLDREEKHADNMMLYYRPLVLVMYDLQARIKQFIKPEFIKGQFSGSMKQATYMVVNTIYTFAECLAWTVIIRDEIHVLTPVLGQDFSTQELLDALQGLQFMFSGETETQGVSNGQSSLFQLLRGQMRLVGESIVEASDQRQNDSTDSTWFAPMTYFKYRSEIMKQGNDNEENELQLEPADQDGLEPLSKLKAIKKRVASSNSKLASGLEPLIDSVMDFFECVLNDPHDELARSTRTRLVAIHTMLMLLLLEMDPETDKFFAKGRSTTGYAGDINTMWANEDRHGLSGHGPLLKHDALLLNFACTNEKAPDGNEDAHKKEGWHPGLVDFLLGSKGLAEVGPLGGPGKVLPNVFFSPGFDFIIKYVDFLPVRDHDGNLVERWDGANGDQANDVHLDGTDKDRMVLADVLAVRVEELGKDRPHESKRLREARDRIKKSLVRKPLYVPTKVDKSDLRFATYFYMLRGSESDKETSDAEARVLLHLYFRSKTCIEKHFRDDLLNARIVKRRMEEKLKSDELMKRVEALAESGYALPMETNDALISFGMQMYKAVGDQMVMAKRGMLGSSSERTSDRKGGAGPNDAQTQEVSDQIEWLTCCAEYLSAVKRRTGYAKPPTGSWATGRQLRRWFHQTAVEYGTSSKSPSRSNSIMRTLTLRDSSTEAPRHLLKRELMRFQTKNMDTKAPCMVEKNGQWGTAWLLTVFTKNRTTEYPNDSRLYKRTLGAWEPMTPADVLKVYKEVRRRLAIEDDIAETQRQCASEFAPDEVRIREMISLARDEGTKQQTLRRQETVKRHFRFASQSPSGTEFYPADAAAEAPLPALLVPASSGTGTPVRAPASLRAGARVAPN